MGFSSATRHDFELWRVSSYRGFELTRADCTYMNVCMQMRKNYNFQIVNIAFNSPLRCSMLYVDAAAAAMAKVCRSTLRLHIANTIADRS